MSTRKHAFLAWLFVIPLAALAPVRGDGTEALDTEAPDTEALDTEMPGTEGGFEVAEKPDRLTITFGGQAVADFVFRDEQILRPYWCNMHGPRGVQVTRRHPPVEGRDATDHPTMHPGIWLGFGDISGTDFWRNRGRIEHIKFVAAPTASDDRLTFATESRLRSSDGSVLGRLTNRMTLAARSSSWLLVWEAVFQADNGELVFGDQEEMGFGARVATPLVEKNGGRVLNDSGTRTAAATWGQPANWCDYSGRSGESEAGMTLMAAPGNFRTSWWHNRDYGVFVANPFGRAAMKQGAPSSVTVPLGQQMVLRFGASIHDAPGYDPAVAWQEFLKLLPEVAKE